MPFSRPATLPSAGPADPGAAWTANRSLLLAVLGSVVLVLDCGAAGS